MRLLATFPYIVLLVAIIVALVFFGLLVANSVMRGLYL